MLQAYQKNNAQAMRIASQRMASATPYRPDLRPLGNPEISETGDLILRVAFEKDFGLPNETDAARLVNHLFPEARVAHERTWIDSQTGVLRVALERIDSSLRLASRKDMPSDFTALAAGVYKKASDNSIWDLRLETDGSYGLYRREAQSEDALPLGERESKPREAGFRPGEFVIVAGASEDRVAIYKGADENGNPVVEHEGQQGAIPLESLRVAATLDLRELEDYYAQAYGSKEYAKALVKNVGGKKRKS